MKKKRLGFRALMLCMAAAMTIAGCSGGNSATPGTESKGEGVTTPAETDNQALEPITFTMFSADPNPNYENMKSPVGQEITKRTGVTLDIEYPVGDVKQKVSIMAAGGDYPDLIYAKADSNLLIEAGALLDLTDLIEEHAPNLKALYGPYMKRLRYSTEDPSIYFVGSFGVYSEQWDPKTGFEIQHRAVKEAGYPEIKTLKDYEKVIKDFVDKNPTTDGKPTIGMSLLADDWRFRITVTNPAVLATGGPDDGEWYVDPQTKKASLHITRPEEKEYFRWLNHMNDMGLLDQESFTQKYDQYEAKIASGQVVGLADARWQHWNAENQLREGGKHDMMYGVYPVTLTEDMKYADFQSSGYSAGWGIGISTSAKDPVRAIKFLDWLASEEAQILNNWGIEGEHYTVENGKRVISEEEMKKRFSDSEYYKKTGIGVYAYPFPEYGDGALDSTGQTFTVRSPEQIAENYTEVEKEVLAQYDAKLWMDLFPSVDEFPVKEYGAAWQINIPQDSNANVILQRIFDLVKKRAPEAIMAKPEEFDAIWDAMLQEIDKAGRAELEETFNELLADRYKLWNE
ncbi:ABC transporter substrate-binding protein [Paenibacillus sp. F411]|uniref:ABC transporter substrate-binding protein n=1 Tax=Paenibacillus sp. F411 TaxID=2820239 RepID=UPI001AAE790F|nr:ABC transporter substrate-binding protein [Paenibacillus sp. F411]MBO2942414.1 ABC transporter substrate-binding protein [Paenibacillus sp. F411]